MNTKTLDRVVRELLADRGYTLHFYRRFLTLAARGVEELNIDTLGSVSGFVTTVDQYGTISLAQTAIDVVTVGIENGIHIIPLTHDEKLNKRINIDASGNRIPFEAVGSSRAELLLTDALYGPLTEYRNDKGEHMGRFFNHIPDTGLTYYHDDKQSKLVINPKIAPGTRIYLEVLYADNSLISVPHVANVDMRAVESLKQYMLWKYMEANPKLYGIGMIQLHREQFYVEHKKLRARLNDLGVSEIKRILRKNGANVPRR
jgi:hypothetical protein